MTNPSTWLPIRILGIIGQRNYRCYLCQNNSSPTQKMCRGRVAGSVKYLSSGDELSQHSFIGDLDNWFSNHRTHGLYKLVQPLLVYNLMDGAMHEPIANLRNRGNDSTRLGSIRFISVSGLCLKYFGDFRAGAFFDVNIDESLKTGEVVSIL